MLKVLISFSVGAAVGAAAALLLAPSSGEELRNHLYDIAEADRERMRAEYQRGMEDLQLRMDKMSTDISSAIQKGKGDAAQEVANAAEEVAEAAEDVADVE
jgi:gas vesicle protein